MDNNLVIYYNQQVSGGRKLKSLDDLKHKSIWRSFVLLRGGKKTLKRGCFALMMTNFIKGIQMEYSVWPNSFSMNNFKS